MSVSFCRTKKLRLSLLLSTDIGSLEESKSAYIRRRVKLVTGKSVADALTVQVPDKDGAMGPYKKSDFKYDVKSGFLVF